MRMSSLIGEYVHVAATDDALDRQVEDFRERYERAIETGAIDGLPLKNGGKPRLWRLRHLDVEEGAWLLDQAQAGCGPHRLAYHAIALALVGVDELRDFEGRPTTVMRAPDRARGGLMAASRDSLEWALRRVGIDTLRDLGNRILQDLSPPNG